MEIGEIFENSNGRWYKVLAQKGKFTLLEKVGSSCQPYIVVWGIKSYPDGISWTQGVYFDILERALKWLNES